MHTGEGNGDTHGHGTHCAGTIFGGTVGGVRIGIAPGIDRAFIGKVLDGGGGGSTDQILDGIMWAARSGATKPSPTPIATPCPAATCSRSKGTERAAMSSGAHMQIE